MFLENRRLFISILVLVELAIVSCVTAKEMS